MAAMYGESRLARYYDWLSRYQSLVARLGYKGGFDRLTAHRLLRSDGGGVAPADVVHHRLVSALGPLRSPRVVDAGCGAGGTVFFLQGCMGGQYDGLTLSPVQQKRAAREAARRGLSRCCRFHVRSYDEDVRDLVPEGAHVIVAIESLAHSRDPARSLLRLAQALATGGRLAIVDDVPVDSLDAADQDFVAFRRGWSCPAIASDHALAAGLDEAGLSIAHEEDLTPRVPLRDPGGLERLVRANRRWRAVAGRGALGPLLDSLHGGLMLERLYRRGLMRYRLVLACRATTND